MTELEMKKKESSLLKDKNERKIPKELVEFDIIVQLPPKKEWTVRVKITSVEKATPRIVEPEEI